MDNMDKGGNMPKIDKIKEEIGWLKVVFALLFATDLSLIAYLFNNLEMLSVIKIVLVLIGLFFVTLGMLYINKVAMSKIESLEDI